MERPLKEVSTKALYALHNGIENREGLSGRYFHNHMGPKYCRACSLGAMGHDKGSAKLACIDLGLLMPDEDMGLSFTDAGTQVSVTNDAFKGTSKNRREHMLRHIVEELRQRKESLPVKTNVKYQEVK